MIPPPPDLDSLLNAALIIDGVEHRVRLRVPSTGQTHFHVSKADIGLTPTLVDHALRADALVEQMDGAQVGFLKAEALMANLAVRTQVLQLRERLFSTLIEAGVARPVCPACGAEVEVSLSEFAGLVRSPPKPLCDQDGNLTVPSLAHFYAVGRRPPGALVASRMHFTLPSVRVGLPVPARGGLLGDLETDAGLQRESDAWCEWVPWNTPLPPEKSHWNRSFPGFRAVLRTSSAVKSLDGVQGRITPEVIESLPATDWLFLDLSLIHI